jgi:hypothetical protein
VTMDQSYNEQYAGSEPDPAVDLDFDLDDEDFDDENGDLMRVIGMAGGAAALIGGLIILLGRKKETPTEKLVAQAQSVGKDVRKAVKNADLPSLLADARDAANARLRDANLQDLARGARDTGGAAVAAVGAGAASVDLEKAIGAIGDRLGAIESGGRRGARRARKEGRRALENIDLSSVPDDVSSQLSDLWAEVGKRAESVGWADAIGEAGKEVRKLNRKLRKSSGVDLSGLADLLDALKSQVGDAGKRVQEDVLPAVQGTLADDVLPEARKRARAAGEALSAVADEARKRGGQVADAYAPEVKKRVGQGAESAKGFSGQVTDLLKALALEGMNRMMSDVVPAAKKGGARAADTMRDDTLPWLRHRADEVRSRAEDLAPQVLDAAGQAPGKVKGVVVDTAAPAVADTLSSAVGALGDAVSRARPKAGEAVQNGGSGVGGAISAVGRKAGDAVGATVDTTKYVTGESSRILFWLSMLSGLVLLIFVPDPDKQKEIWNNVQGFLGELRSMFGDIGDQGEQATDLEYTGDAGV